MTLLQNIPYINPPLPKILSHSNTHSLGASRLITNVASRVVSNEGQLCPKVVAVVTDTDVVDSAVWQLTDDLLPADKTGIHCQGGTVCHKLYSLTFLLTSIYIFISCQHSINFKKLTP